VATRMEHVPIDFELYRPQAWTEDSARQLEARIPDGSSSKPSPSLRCCDEHLLPAFLRAQCWATLPRPPFCHHLRTAPLSKARSPGVHARKSPTTRVR
jgi:hypothetical protein